jgi:hypothetical protein
LDGVGSLTVFFQPPTWLSAVLTNDYSGCPVNTKDFCVRLLTDVRRREGIQKKPNVAPQAMLHKNLISMVFVVDHKRRATNRVFSPSAGFRGFQLPRSGSAYLNLMQSNDEYEGRGHKFLEYRAYSGLSA